MISGTHPPSLLWHDLLKPLLGGAVDLVLEPRPDDPDAPRLDYGSDVPEPVAILIRESDVQNWRANLLDALASREWAVCYANLIAIPSRTLRGTLEGSRIFDQAAFVFELLNNSPAGGLVVMLVPRAFLIMQTHSPVRRWIEATHRVEAIVYLGSEAAQLVSAHPSFEMAALCIRVGPPLPVETTVVRLIDLSSSPRTDWASRVRAAMKRGGGEADSSIVLRNTELGDGPWTYERYSESFRSMQEDASQLGTLCPLGTFIADVRVGLNRRLEASRMRDLGDEGAPVAGTIACYGGRSVGRGGKLQGPVCAVLTDGLPAHMLLHSGDVLVRRIVGITSDRLPVVAATVPEGALPATFDSDCIRLRWRSDVPPNVADILAGYLNSSHARDWFVANGGRLAFTEDILRRLEVPEPSKEVLAALETLADAERQYQQWADEAATVSREVFESARFAEQLPRLLSSQRLEMDRLRAARDAGTLDYQVRNSYPHPIALRREQILQTPPGRERLEAVLDCAEHFVMLLAVLAILQEATAEVAGPVRSRLRSYARDRTFGLDWGKSSALLLDGTRFTAKHVNPMSLAFPQLIELAAPMNDLTSSWSHAEKELREWRHDRAHLRRVPDSDLLAKSEDAVASLDCLLEAASFMSAVPLVHVADYERDPLTNDRVGTFQFLEGISPVFRRQAMKVESELARGAVGFLSHRGSFISATPWLSLEHCPLCKRPEVFILSRLEPAKSSYLAMETGHAQENPALGNLVRALLFDSSPS